MFQNKFECRLNRSINVAVVDTFYREHLYKQLSLKSKSVKQLSELKFPKSQHFKNIQRLTLKRYKNSRSILIVRIDLAIN